MDAKKNNSTIQRPGPQTRCQQITEARLRAQAIRAAASRVTHERLDDLMEAVDNEE